MVESPPDFDTGRQLGTIRSEAEQPGGLAGGACLSGAVAFTGLSIRERLRVLGV